MKVEDLVKYHGVQLDPSPRDASELGFLPAILNQCGYHAEGLRDLLGVADIPNIDFQELPGYLWRCGHEDSPRARMARLWLFCQKLGRAHAEEVLGREGVATLLHRGMLRRTDDLVEACVDVYPCEGAWVFTDRMLGLSRFSQHVYELGKDSFALARATPRAPVQSTLDLCTGSGIHAIVAAGHSERCVGVDLNGRALKFARVNAGMNQVGDRCRFLQGDLYGPVEGETFDLIVSNPPWVPTPDEKMEIYRTGGETGEDITQRTIEGLPGHLRPGGTLSMFVIYPILRGSSYVDRIRSWLGDATGWGVTVTVYSESTVEGFVRLHVNPSPDWLGYEREFRRWMDSYHRLGIEKVGLGTVYVRRLPSSHPGWGEERRVLFPLHPLGSRVTSRLDRLSRYHAETALEDDRVPERDPEVRHLWLEACGGDGCVEFDDSGWAPAVHLEPREAVVAALVDGRRSMGNLVAEVAARAATSPADVRNEVESIVRGLGIKGFLR